MLNPPILQAGNLISSNVYLSNLKIEGNVTLGGKLLAGPNRFDVIAFLQKVARKSKYQEISGKVLWALN